MEIGKFVQFEDTGKRIGTYAISISRAFGFGFLSAFYRKNNISTYKYVVLFFNKDEMAIGFAFTNDGETKGRFTITHSLSKTSAGVTAMTFFNRIGIDKLSIEKYAKQYKVYESVHQQFGKIYYIKLNE